MRFSASAVFGSSTIHTGNRKAWLFRFCSAFVGGSFVPVLECDATIIRVRSGSGLSGRHKIEFLLH